MILQAGILLVLFPYWLNVTGGFRLTAEVRGENSSEESSQESVQTVTGFDLQNQVNQSLLDFQTDFVRKLAAYYAEMVKRDFSMLTEVFQLILC